jgi:ubiquinol oxidase
LGVNNLYEVFVNIRDDECKHVKTMEALQLPEARQTFKSPHTVFELMATSADKMS